MCPRGLISKGSCCRHALCPLDPSWPLLTPTPERAPQWCPVALVTFSSKTRGCASASERASERSRRDRYQRQTQMKEGNRMWLLTDAPVKRRSRREKSCAWCSFSNRFSSISNSSASFSTAESRLLPAKADPANRNRLLGVMLAEGVPDATSFPASRNLARGDRPGEVRSGDHAALSCCPDSLCCPACPLSPPVSSLVSPDPRLSPNNAPLTLTGSRFAAALVLMASPL